MVFKIQRNGSPVAMLDLKHLGGGDYEIAWLETLPEYRGQGHATKLIRKAKEYVVEKGNALVGYLEPKDGLTHAQMVDWHKRMGFKSGWYEFEPGNNKRVMIWSPERT